MDRFDSETATRVRVFVPSFFVVQPTVDLPPEVPGKVRPEHLFEKDLPPRFLVPWPSAMPPRTKNASDIVDWGCNPHEPIPCEVDGVALAAYLAKYPVSDTVVNILGKSAAFDSKPNNADSAGGEADAIMASLANPFTTARRVDDSIVWTIDKRLRVDATLDVEGPQGPKKSGQRHHRMTRNVDGWSIVSYVSGPPERPRDDNGDAPHHAMDASAKAQTEVLESLNLSDAMPPVVRKNIIYNGDGIAIAQVDFGHGTSVGTHVHSLAKDNLAHVASSLEDHLFHLPSVPWPWMCIPIDPTFVFAEPVVRSTMRRLPDGGRSSSVIRVPTVLQRAIKMASGKLGGEDAQRLLQGYPAEVNPFAGHLPPDRFLSYNLPSTIDWDTYNDPSWRWLAVDLPFEDFSASAMGMVSREGST